MQLLLFKLLCYGRGFMSPCFIFTTTLLEKKCEAWHGNLRTVCSCDLLDCLVHFRENVIKVVGFFFFPTENWIIIKLWANKLGLHWNRSWILVLGNGTIPYSFTYSCKICSDTDILYHIILCRISLVQEYMVPLVTRSEISECLSWLMIKAIVLCLNMKI